jgi:hypothetical protein
VQQLRTAFLDDVSAAQAQGSRRVAGAGGHATGGSDAVLICVKLPYIVLTSSKVRV